MNLRTRRRRLRLEQLETRDLLATSISGLVFQTADTVDPSAQLPGPGVGNVTVSAKGQLPGDNFTTTTTASGNNVGQYQLGDLLHPLPADTYTVSIQLPANFWGFTAQSIQSTVVLADKEAFGNLNFGIMPTSQAIAQNLYQRVLVRSGDLGGFNFWSTGLGNGSISPGQAFVGFLGSSEFLTLDAPLAGMLAALDQNKQLPLDPNLFRHNEQLIRNAVTPDAAVLNTIYTQSFVTQFGDTSQLSNSDFVTFVYNELLHQAPDANAGFWTSQLNANALNRGQLMLALLGQPQFQIANPAVADEVAVSMAYLGLLGRSADLGGYQFWLGQLMQGMSITQMANQFAGSAEFMALQGFADPLLADAAAQPIEPTVPVLNRLEQYDPATKSFDTAVTAQGISGQTTSSNPVDLYVWVHGWSPGYQEDELLNSTPGNPLSVWGTVDFPGGSPPVPASASLFDSVTQVSVEGMAQAIVDTDPNAVVLAYSWLDAAATGGAGINALLGGAQSESNTQQDGYRLAEALESALAPNFYSQGGLIHLMGHSHGSKVATVATLRMQQDGFPITQLTTLESPEDGPTGATVEDNSGKTIDLKDQHLPGLIAAQNFDWYFMQQLNSNANNNVVTGRTPVTATGGQISGQDPTYIDNYYSTDGVGMPFGGFGPLTGVFPNPQSLSNIADANLNPQVLYPPPATIDSVADLEQFFGTVGGSHNYPPPWYTQAQIPPSAMNSNGLAWSPLLNDAPPSGGPGLYTQQVWPANDLSQQFNLTGPVTDSPLAPFAAPFDYATEYQTGMVKDNGTGTITLGRGTNPLSMDAVTFTPLANNGPLGDLHPNGTGLSLQFQFQNAAPGDELIVWTRGLVNLTIQSPKNPQSSGSLGYGTVPLLMITGTDAEITPQFASLSLDLLGNEAGLITGNGNLADGLLGQTQQPVIGFSLLHDGNSQSTVTITNLQQFSDGT